LIENERVRNRGYDLEEIVNTCGVYNMIALSMEEVGRSNEALKILISFET